ncbi:nuclear transport factor 2 family protein [Gammaproteobacteria bacterium]|nr:nuclear transport factor 2 family protein [Gammaproteobacteria bacterium]
MTRVVKGIAAVLLSLSTLGPHADAPSGAATVETLLKEVVTGLYDAIAEHRLEQAIRFYHSNSPEIARARAEIELSQAAYLQKTLTLSFAYTGRREDLALGTARHHFLRIAGVKFFEDIAEVSYVFRKEGGAWKLWTSRVQ